MDFKDLPPLVDRKSNQYARGMISGMLTEVVRSGPGGGSTNPFAVFISRDPDTLNYTATVIDYGQVNFLFQNADVVVTNPGESPIAIGDLIWLDIAVSGFSGPTGADIVFGSSSGWTDSPAPVSFDSDPGSWDGSSPVPAQTHAYLLIAEIVDDGLGNPKVRQCVTTHLTIYPVSYYGLTAYVPMAGFGSLDG